MKTTEEIEKMARDGCPEYRDQLLWISGYTQCQQDNAALIACLEQKITMMQRVFDGIAHFAKR